MHDHAGEYIVGTWREWRSYLKGHVHGYKRLHPCRDCGETDIDLLTFHHRDPALKERTISDGGNFDSLDDLYAEIAKCDVLCKECHRAEHGHYGAKKRSRLRCWLWRLYRRVRQ